MRQNIHTAQTAKEWFDYTDKNAMVLLIKTLCEPFLLLISKCEEVDGWVSGRERVLPAL